MNHDDPEPKIQWGKMIGVSLAIHVAIIGGVVVFASGSAPHRALYAPSISVSLYGPGKIREKDGSGGAPGGTATIKNKSARDQVIEKAAPQKLEKADLVQPKIISKTLTPKKEVKSSQKIVRVSKKAPLKKRAKVKRSPTPKKVAKVKRSPTPKKVAKVKRSPAPKKVAKVKRQTRPKNTSSAHKRGTREKSLSTVELDRLAKIRRRLLSRKGQPGSDGIGKNRRQNNSLAGVGNRGEGSLPGERNAYKNELGRIFYEAWVLPDSLRNRGLKVILVLHIDRSGKILKTDIKETSGNRLFDESVKRAVSKVKTGGGVPPLPSKISEAIWEQGLIFDPKYKR